MVKLQIIEQTKCRIDNLNRLDYFNEFSKKHGFKDFNEYQRTRNHKKGINKSVNENIKCPLWLGTYISENILPSIFENPKRMPFGNKGFDFICKNGYKIDVKSSCLNNTIWTFGIHKNVIADYFLLIGFSKNKYELNPMHVWLIKANEISRHNKKFNELVGLGISNSKCVIKWYKKYELIDKLDKVKELCMKFKKN